MSENDVYLEKYIKYKNKYLNLKKQLSTNSNLDKLETLDEFGGSGWTDTFKVFSDVGFNMMISRMPPQYKKIYSDMVNSGLLTESNKKIIFELLKSGLTHLTDPNFYPIMFEIFLNMVILAGSAETLTPPIILAALQRLYASLKELKSQYPNDFVLMKEFLIMNREKILNIVNKYSNGNEMISRMSYDIFTKLVSV
jgi:hypothetical protein